MFFVASAWQAWLWSALGGVPRTTVRVSGPLGACLHSYHLAEARPALQEATLQLKDDSPHFDPLPQVALRLFLQSAAALAPHAASVPSSSSLQHGSEQAVASDGTAGAASCGGGSARCAACSAAGPQCLGELFCNGEDADDGGSCCITGQNPDLAASWSKQPHITPCQVAYALADHVVGPWIGMRNPVYAAHLLLAEPAFADVIFQQHHQQHSQSQKHAPRQPISDDMSRFMDRCQARLTRLLCALDPEAR